MNSTLWPSWCCCTGRWAGKYLQCVPPPPLFDAQSVGGWDPEAISCRFVRHRTKSFFYFPLLFHFPLRW